VTGRNPGTVAGLGWTRLIDLTAPIHEGMVLNHPNQPRAPLLWYQHRHETSQWTMTGRWEPPGKPVLYGLPPEAGQPGQGHGIQTEHVLIGTHMGTHMDAPVHYDHRSEEDIASIDLERCCGTALLLDVRETCRERRCLKAADLERAAQKAGVVVEEGSIILIHTGHSARYGQGPQTHREKWATEFPGVADDGIAWILERRLRLVGIDSPSVDCDFATPAHVNFLLRPWVGEPAILLVENLVNLEQVDATSCFFMALPLPIRGGSGSPVRAVALV
jgi:kynurenine formamidase